MSTLVNFNSTLLNALSKEWKGSFYDKFFLALKTFKEQKTLRPAVLKIFPRSELEVEKPSEEAFQNFAQGNTARDAKVLQYLDRALAGIILDGQFIAYPHEIPQELMQHETLKKYRVASLVLMNKPSLEPLRITSLDDLCFVGCIGMLQADRLQDSEEETSSIEFDVDPKAQDGINYLQINRGVFKETIEELVEKGKYPTLLNQFLSFNEGAIRIEKSSLQLKNILPEVFAASSFLWQENTLNLTPEAVESMSENQKLMTLIENKTAVIERCFTHLAKTMKQPMPYTFNKDILRILLKHGNDLSNLLAQRREIQERYSTSYKAAREQKNKFLELSQTLGIEDKQAANKLLQLFSMRSVDLNTLKTSDIEKFFINILLDYKDKTIKAAKEKSLLNDLDAEIQSSRKSLELNFGDILHDLRNLSQKSQTIKLEILKVYTTFSLVLLNKDLFPEAPLKKDVQRKGAQKIASLFTKIRLKKPVSQWKDLPDPIERLEGNDAFQAIFNRQVIKIFKAYQKPSPTYQYTQLTPTDLLNIEQAAARIQNLAAQGNQEAIEKFSKLESILYDLLVSQQAFRNAIARESRIDRDRLQSLQSHVYACLIFANHPNQKMIDGSISIKELLSGIAKNMTDQGIKEKIVQSNKQIIKTAEALALSFQPEDIEQVNEKTIIGKNYDQIKNKALQVVEKSGMNHGLIKQYQASIDKIVEEIRGSINSTDRFWNEVIGLDSLEFSKFFQQHADQPLSSDFRAIVYRYMHFVVPNAPRTLREALQEFRTFIIDHNIEISPRSGRHWSVWKNTHIKDDEYLLAKAFIANELQRSIQHLKQKSYEVVPRSFDPSPENRQIDVFSNQNLFQLYERNNISTLQNQKTADALYWEFLPIFVSSFLGAQKLFAQNSFLQAKAQFIKQLPAAKAVIHDVEKWLRENQGSINEINDYLKSEVTKNLDSLRGDPEALSSFMENMLKNGEKLFQRYTGMDFKGLGNYVLISTVISAGLMIALFSSGLLGALSIASSAVISGAITLLSFAGVAILQNKVFPYLKELLNTLLEGIERLAGRGRYNENAPMDYLLTTLQMALELESSSFDKFKDMGHKMQFGNFVNQVYEVLEKIPQDLNAFKEKIHQLVPEAMSQANFSVMALNMIGFLNSDGFQVLPQNLLKSVSHSSFKSAVQEYLESYKQALDHAGQEFEGNKTLEHSHETAYSRYLKSKEIRLEFSENSSIGRCLVGKAQSFRLQPEDIIPYQKMSPSLIAINLQKLVDKSKSLSENKELFDQKLRPVFQQIHGAFNKPLRKQEKEQFTQALLASYEMVRYGFSLARSTIDARLGVPLPYKNWLEATQENPTSIFNSRLFTDALSFLEKTAFALSTTDAEHSMDLLRLIYEIKSLKNDYLSTGVLILPASSTLRELEQSVVDATTHLDDYPAIALPGLMELEQNKAFFVPLVIWQAMKNHLRQENGNQSLDLLVISNTSSRLYLTGQDLNLFFSSSELRGDLFNIWTVNALENIAKRYSNRQLRQFLGYINQNVEASQSIPQSLASKLPWNQRDQQQALPQSNNAQLAPIHPSQRYVMPNNPSRAVDPNTGLSQAQYDPENRGISAQDAPYYYQAQLPEGMKNYLGNRNQLDSQDQIEGRSQLGMGFQNQVNQTRSQERQFSNQQRQPQPQNPMIFPMGFEQEQMNEQQMHPQVLPEERSSHPISENQQPLMIGVDANGKSFSFSGGSSQDRPLANQLSQEADRSRRQVEAMQNQPSGFPSANNQPYINPLNQNYNPIVPPDPQFPWGKALAIGGGAALGAGLLAYGLSNDNKRKKK